MVASSPATVPPASGLSAIGAPVAYWDWHDDAHPSARRAMQARIGTPAGRAALRALGVRMPDRWEPPESPEDVIGKVLNAK